MNRHTEPPALGPLVEGLVSIDLRIGRKDEVYLRSLLEAYDGLGFLIGAGDGAVRLATTPSQGASLKAFVADLTDEIRMVPLRSED